jgi:hypothetical protein
MTGKHIKGAEQPEWEAEPEWVPSNLRGVASEKRPMMVVTPEQWWQYAPTPLYVQAGRTIVGIWLLWMSVLGVLICLGAIKGALDGEFSLWALPGGILGLFVSVPLLLYFWGFGKKKQRRR